MIFVLMTLRFCRNTFCLLMCLSFLTLSGCTNDDEVRACWVTGLVTLDNEPITGGSVLLISADGTSGSSEIVSGTYTLDCKPGTYMVAVSPPPPHDPITGPPPKLSENAEQVPKHYHDPGTSKITAEVVAGENLINIPLVSD